MNIRGLTLAIFFAYSAFFICKLLIIRALFVEAAGVEPDTRVENAQVVDSGNARIAIFCETAKSNVRSLYSQFPEFQDLPNSTFRRSPLRERAF